MKTPNEDESKKCLRIRKRNRRNEYVSPEDIRFCEKLYDKYTEWYTKAEDEVFNDTVPVGSNVRRVNGETVYLK
jgi:deoxyadenosine/deoxycytidine kinase